MRNAMWKGISAALALAALIPVVQGCANEKAQVTEDLSDLSALDTKSDQLSARVKLVGSLDYGQTSAVVNYTSVPRFRAFKFAGDKGDKITVDVTSSNGGDPVTWLVDDGGRELAFNDDYKGSTDSHIEVTLKPNKRPDIRTYYIVFRDYDLHSAKFRVKLTGPSNDFYSCNVDADCEKTYDSCCRQNAYVGIKKGMSAAYHAALGCAANTVCPAVAWPQNYDVPVCNENKKCDLVKPEEYTCAGFRMPPRACPTGYTCAAVDGDPRADHPSKCYKPCGGISGQGCGPGFQCTDVPYDACDPANGGADCPAVCKPVPTDCRTTGCPSGSNCDVCWGGFSCVPDGAIC